MTSTLSVFDVPTVTLRDLGGEPTPGQGRHLLGIVDFTTTSGDITVDGSCPRVSVHLADTAAEGFAEVWTTARPVTHGRYGEVFHAADGEFLFCAFRLPEQPAYADATEAAYADALAITSSLGYRPFRIWHYISRLNEPNAAGLEVYRDFCIGRSRVLERHGITHDMPAATVVGAHGGGIVCYLLAHRSGTQVNLENPRQVPAYHYPRQYGPRSPNFARATHLTTRDGAELVYVSGTAGILGHRTMHEGDAVAQCRLALENVAQVISAGNMFAHDVDGERTLADLTTVKVYVRHRADLPAVREICAAALPGTADVAYLNTDICRADLLVELEGITAALPGDRT